MLNQIILVSHVGNVIIWDAQNFLWNIKFEVRLLFCILLTTPSGLTQWFSESCDINEEIYTFGWDGSLEDAELVEGIDPEKVVFKWVDGEEDEFFSFEITKSEISNDTVLYLTDFADDDEVEDQKQLWLSQFEQLTKRIGA